MKQITTKLPVFLAFIFVFALFFSSCSTSESVVSNSFLQKRKYNKGFHKTGKTNVKTGATQHEEVLVLNNSNVNEVKVVAVSEKAIKEVEVAPVSAVVETEEVAVASVKTPINNEVEAPVSTKNKIAQVLENKVEKLTATLKGESIISNSTSNTANTTDDMFILLIILAIILPFLAVGIYTNWDITKTLIALLLFFLFWIPGVIYALIVITK